MAKKHAVNRAGWEDELPAIESALRGYLAVRLPRCRGIHDDLVSEALLGLVKWLRRHEGKPLAPTASRTEEGEGHTLSALAVLMLKRRIADRFRLDSREWRRRVELDDEALANRPAKSAPIERTLLRRQMLDIVIGVLATMTAEDRDLIAFNSARSPGEQALTPRERQRLHRARRRILNAIVAELGETPTALLRDDE